MRKNLLVIGVAGSCLAFLPGATCNTPSAATVETTIPADANFALCEATVVEDDNGQPWEKIVSDSFEDCSTDVSQIVTELDSQTAASVAKGTTTLADANTKIVAIHAAGNAKLVAIHATTTIAPPKPLVMPVKRVKHT